MAMAPGLTAIAAPPVLLGLAAITLAILGFGAALNLASPAIEAIGKVITALGGAFSKVIGSVGKGVEGIVNAIAGLLTVNPASVIALSSSMLLLGPGLVGVGAGMVALGASLMLATPGFLMFYGVAKLLGGGAGLFSPIQNMVNSMTSIKGLDEASKTMSQVAGFLSGLKTAFFEILKASAGALFLNALEGLGNLIGTGGPMAHLGTMIGYLGYLLRRIVKSVKPVLDIGADRLRNGIEAVAGIMTSLNTAIDSMPTESILAGLGNKISGMARGALGLGDPLDSFMLNIASLGLIIRLTVDSLAGFMLIGPDRVRNAVEAIPKIITALTTAIASMPKESIMEGLGRKVGDFARGLFGLEDPLANFRMSAIMMLASMSLIMEKVPATDEAGAKLFEQKMTTLVSYSKALGALNDMNESFAQMGTITDLTKAGKEGIYGFRTETASKLDQIGEGASQMIGSVRGLLEQIGPVQALSDGQISSVEALVQYAKAVKAIGEIGTALSGASASIPEGGIIFKSVSSFMESFKENATSMIQETSGVVTDIMAIKGLASVDSTISVVTLLEGMSKGISSISKIAKDIADASQQVPDSGVFLDSVIEDFREDAVPMLEQISGMFNDILAIEDTPDASKIEGIVANLENQGKGLSALGKMGKTASEANTAFAELSFDGDTVTEALQGINESMSEVALMDLQSFDPAMAMLDKFEQYLNKLSEIGKIAEGINIPQVDSIQGLPGAQIDNAQYFDKNVSDAALERRDGVKAVSPEYQERKRKMEEASQSRIAQNTSRSTVAPATVVNVPKTRTDEILAQILIELQRSNRVGSTKKANGLLDGLGA